MLPCKRTVVRVLTASVLVLSCADYMSWRYFTSPLRHLTFRLPEGWTLVEYIQTPDPFDGASEVLLWSPQTPAAAHLTLCEALGASPAAETDKLEPVPGEAWYLKNANARLPAIYSHAECPDPQKTPFVVMKYANTVTSWLFWKVCRGGSGSFIAIGETEGDAITCS